MAEPDGYENLGDFDEYSDADESARSSGAGTGSLDGTAFRNDTGRRRRRRTRGVDGILRYPDGTTGEEPGWAETHAGSGQSGAQAESLDVSAGARGQGGSPSGRGKKSKIDTVSAKAMAAMFVTLVQNLAVQIIGTRAAFTPSEKALIEPSLARMLERLPSRMAANLMQFADPAMLFMGLSLWVVRLYQGEPTPRREPPPVEPVQPASQQDRQYGTDSRNGFVAPIPAEILQFVGSDV